MNSAHPNEKRKWVDGIHTCQDVLIYRIVVRDYPNVFTTTSIINEEGRHVKYAMGDAFGPPLKHQKINFMDIIWFNLNPEFNTRVLGYRIKWFNLFHRKSDSDRFWGIGILQINKRHLFYIGHSGISILFIGTP